MGRVAAHTLIAVLSSSLLARCCLTWPGGVRGAKLLAWGWGLGLAWGTLWLADPDCRRLLLVACTLLFDVAWGGAWRCRKSCV